METYTYSTYFDREKVDELVGAAHRELESDYLRRKDVLDSNLQRAMEARLQALRSAWILLLDRVPY